MAKIVKIDPKNLEDREKSGVWDIINEKLQVEK